MKKILFACALALVCGISWGVVGAWLFAQELFQSQAQLVSALPLSDSVYEALHKAADLTDTIWGEALVRRCGYTPEFYFWENVVWLCVLTVGLFFTVSCDTALECCETEKAQNTYCGNDTISDCGA